MERTKQKLMWRKLGGGSLHLGNRIIKPNQKFEAFENEIPKGFRDIVECLDKEVLEKQESIQAKAVAAPQENYKLKEDLSKGWWNVVNIENGKPFNDKKLRKTAAEELLNTVNGF